MSEGVDLVLQDTRTGELIRQYFSVMAELGRLFPKRSFVPDAHVVEGFCEVLAAEQFALDLLPASSKIHNARTRDKTQMVQIKSTQSETVVFRSDQIPEHLLVMRLSEQGEPELIYNGPGILAYERPGKQPSNGQRSVRLASLRKIPVAAKEQLQSIIS